MEMSQCHMTLRHCQKTKTNHTDPILHFEAGRLFLNAYMHYSKIFFLKELIYKIQLLAETNYLFFFCPSIADCTNPTRIPLKR